MITLSNISKTYRISRKLFSRHKSAAKPSLDNINIKIKAGERVAILGRNGSGKTTLLRIVAGILTPTTGQLQIEGKIHTLMQTSLGINEQFTGYENILSALTYCDISTENHAEVIQDIIDFCEFKEFLHIPFRCYSAGMKVRLAFAIATAIKPEILLIDEVLGAGDPYFLLKCQHRLENVIKKNKVTLLLVSHSMQQLKQFCDRAIWLKDGKIFYDGEANAVINAYETYMEQLAAKSKIADIQSPEELFTKIENDKLVYKWHQDSHLKIVSAEIANSTHATIAIGESLTITVTLHSSINQTLKFRMLLTFWHLNGRRMGRLENQDKEAFFSAQENKTFTIKFKNILPPGRYTVNISLYDISHTNTAVDATLTRLEVAAHIISLTSIPAANPHNLLPHQWETQHES